MILEILTSSAVVALGVFSRPAMVVALRAAVLGLLVGPCAGCSPTPPPCSDVIRENENAIFNLSCGPTDLTGVDLSGPCSVGDASPSHYLIGPGSKSLAIASPSPGRCHVALTLRHGLHPFDGRHLHVAGRHGNPRLPSVPHGPDPTNVRR